MVKYFIFLLFPVCLLCAVEDTDLVRENVETPKVKRDTVFESETNLNQGLPLSESVVRSRQKRAASKSYIFLDNRSGKTAKLYWRDISKKGKATYYTSLQPSQTISLNTYEVHEWTAYDLNGERLMMNNKRTLVQTANGEDNRAIYLISRPGQKDTKIGDRYVEMMVVMDKAAVEMHENTEEAKRYVITYLRLATTVLQHKDLAQHGVKLHLVLSKLVMLKRDLDDVKMNPEDGENNLVKVCRYMNKIGKSDHKLFLTRNAFGMGGYANTGGMCTQFSSCSIVYDQGFTASFLVAHEIAHSLGLDDRVYKQGSGYMMSQMVDAGFNNYRWSTYSQVSLLENIKKRKHSCLHNKPTMLKGLPFVHKYPGTHFSFTQQCHLEYDKEHSEWKHSKDPCKQLKCQMPPPYSNLAKTLGSPPLDGTECGTNKWCLSGKCTLKSAKDESTPAAKVDGGWGDWEEWSRCSRTCSTGVQARVRRCNKPLPKNGGRPCIGFSNQVKVCHTKKTCPKSVSEKDVVCTLAGRRRDHRRQWKFYDTTANLNCDFENNDCKWTDDMSAATRKWLPHKGNTLSGGTGPSVDHTLKTAKGTYIYLESSSDSTTSAKAKAVLTSPEIKIAQGCLQFWYHMWGDHKMGVLKVTKSNKRGKTTLWRQSGNRGNRWFYKAVDVRDTNPYKILFVAKEKGNGYKSDIALDDITFRTGSCSSARISQTRVEENPCTITCKTSDNRRPSKTLPSVNLFDGTRCSTKTATGVCYLGNCKHVGCEDILTDDKKDNCVIAKGRKPSKITSVTKTRPTSRLDCNFDRNYCHWRNIPNTDKINWLRARQTIKGKTKGYILQVRRLIKQGGIKVASIASPEVSDPIACLTFSYKVLRRRGGYARLRVKSLTKYGTYERPTTRAHLSITGEAWKEKKVEFQSTRPYKVVFEATIGRGYNGPLAIDNIRFDTGKCPSSKG